jgi:hypothetical protein
MLKYVAKRIRFRNGKRYSVLSVPNGLPVHEVAVYLDKYRRKGRAANTIHFVCCSLALLFRELDKAKVKLQSQQMLNRTCIFSKDMLADILLHRAVYSHRWVRTELFSFFLEIT